MRLKIITSLILLALTITATPMAWSKSAGLQSGSVYSEVRLNYGVLNGKSGEYVYDAFGLDSGIPGYKVSQLEWTLDNVSMVGVGLSIAPNERLRFNADYWTNAGEGDATMDDYDWLYIGMDWSHWSHHDDTTVTRARSIDINMEETLFHFNRKRALVTAIFGYKQDHIAWTAVGGYGIYSINAYRDSYVVFPDIPVISYEQTYKMPYLGLGVSTTNTNTLADSRTTLAATIRFSNWVNGEDTDYHHLRDLRFDERGDRGRWLSYEIKLGFQMSRDLTFNLAQTTQRYYEIKASTLITDLVTGDQSFYPGDAAGLEHRSSLLSAGITYRY